MGTGTLRILIADDDPNVLSDVAAVLEDLGATVTRAASGAELIEHLGEDAARDRLAAGGVDVAEWRLRCRDGTYLPVEVSAKIFADGRWQGITRDITERKRAAAALQRAAATERALRAEIETLMGAVAKAVAELPRSDVDAVLRAVADQARALTGARYAAAAIGAEPLREFDRWAVLGMPDDALATIGWPPRAVGLLGHALTTGAALRVPDVARHPAFGGLPPGHSPIGSFLAVPILHRGRLLGALYLANKDGAPEFSEHDANVVTALAERVAVAIETATLHETEARLRAWLQSIIDQLPEGVVVLDEIAQVKARRARRALHLQGPGRGARRPDLGRERERHDRVSLHAAAAAGVSAASSARRLERARPPWICDAAS